MKIHESSAGYRSAIRTYEESQDLFPSLGLILGWRESMLVDGFLNEHVSMQTFLFQLQKCIVACHANCMMQ